MIGFDCNVKLTYEKALEFKRKGFEFVIRYVGRITKAPTIDIDEQEINNILKAGLQLGIVQHCPPKPGIMPSKQLGADYGKNAAIFAKEAKYKAGCIIYLDLEDVNPAFAKKQQEIIDFCNCWYDEVEKVGYTPGVYVGFNAWLKSEELHSKLKFKHYWKSLSSVPDITTRGYEMFQKASSPVLGVQIDVNTVTGDKLGNFPVFMISEKVLTKVVTIKIYSDGSSEVI